mmetsp:Transcript_26462/g.53137  ORF Transcript_26462/g.53137 Transcript_26462/m.53137 type:complete len:322 (-) Transcript_26462:176-1141(-)
MQRNRRKIVMFAMIICPQRKQRIPLPGIRRTRRNASIPIPIPIFIPRRRTVIGNEHGTRRMRRNRPKNLCQIQKQQRFPPRPFPQSSPDQDGPSTVVGAFFVKFPGFVGKKVIGSGECHDEVVDSEEESFEGEGGGEYRGVSEGTSPFPVGEPRSGNGEYEILLFFLPDSKSRSRFSFQLHPMGREEDVSVFEFGFVGVEELSKGCGAGISEGFVVGEVAVAEVEVVAEEGGHGSPEEEEGLEFLLLLYVVVVVVVVFQRREGSGGGFGEERAVEAIVQDLKSPQREHGAREDRREEDLEGVPCLAAQVGHGEERRVGQEE